MYSIIVPTRKKEIDLPELMVELTTKSAGTYEIIVTGVQGTSAVNRNAGLNKAKYDLILMLDDDVKKLPQDWNVSLCTPIQSNSNIVMVSARLVDDTGQLVTMTGGNYNVDAPTVTVQSGVLPTNCIAFLKTELRFDETFIETGFEGTDFCNQMIEKFPNSTHVVNNLVKVVHVSDRKRQWIAWRDDDAYFKSKWKNFRGRQRYTVSPKKISLCMIVKNEEKNIRRCLDSAKDYVDEIIIVDSGSTDSTMEIAKEYGAKIIEIDWEYDFGAARNVGLSHATGDWIIALDADEELVLEDKNGLQKLANVPINRQISYLVRIENIMDDGQVDHHMARFFPNAPTVQYAGKIHEQVVSNDPDFMSVVTVTIKIKHYGYTTAIMDDKDKGARNKDLLNTELSKNPDSDFYKYHLGITLQVQGKHDEAEKAFEEWDKITASHEGQEDVSVGYAGYLSTMIVLNKLEEGLKIADRVAYKCNHNPDFCLNYGMLLERADQLDKAVIYLKRAQSASDKVFPSMVYDTASMTWKSNAILGNIFAKRGNFDKAIQEWEKGLTYVPNHQEMLKSCYLANLQMSYLLEAEKYLSKILKLFPDENTEDNKVNLANIWFNTGREEAALELFHTLPGNKFLIDQLLTMLISHQEFDKVSLINDFIEKNKK